MNSHKPTPTPSSGKVNLSPPTKPRHCKKSPEIGEQWMTRVIPPPLQKGIKMKGIRPFKYDGDSNHIHKNPNILQELSTELQGKNLIRGKLLLKYIENSGQLEWDELGDIYRPMSGYTLFSLYIILLTVPPSMMIKWILINFSSYLVTFHFIILRTKN